MSEKAVYMTNPLGCGNKTIANSFAGKYCCLLSNSLDICNAATPSGPVSDLNCGVSLSQPDATPINAATLIDIYTISLSYTRANPPACGDFSERTKSQLLNQFFMLNPN